MEKASGQDGSHGAASPDTHSLVDDLRPSSASTASTESTESNTHSISIHRAFSRNAGIEVDETGASLAPTATNMTSDPVYTQPPFSLQPKLTKVAFRGGFRRG